MPHTLPVDWLVPDWPAPDGVRAVFTTRLGGVSVAPYDALNLGLQVGDASDYVACNRQLLHQAIGHAPVFMNQVHGSVVLQLPVADRATSLSHALAPMADAACAQAIGQVCTVMVADCLPILLCSTDGAWVAAAHAGWRGLAGVHGFGIMESVLGAFNAMQPVDSAGKAPELIAWLGPCIGPQSFEVGPEVRAAFMADSHHAAMAACFVGQPDGKYLANLPQIARLRLAALGVHRVYGNDGSTSWCTVARPSSFFSYRRDGVTGRMAACIWRD